MSTEDKHKAGLTDKVREAMLEAALDIEEMVRNEYGHPDVHPARQWKYDRDIEIVGRLRYLASVESSPHPDTERLDWLEAQQWFRQNENTWLSFRFGGHVVLRAAIDAARSTEEGKENG